MPSGERIQEISSFALNDVGQVAFFAYAKGGEQLPLGYYLATPVPPSIGSIRLKGGPANLRLIISGNGFITKDSIIQINGQAIETEYPAGFQQDGGTATRLVSRDPTLAQLLPVGQAVQITVSNPLTGTRSATVSFNR